MRGPAKKQLKCIKVANGKYKRGPDQIAHQVEEKTRKRARRNLQKLVEKGLRTEEEADIIAQNYVPYKEVHKQAETLAVNHFNGIRTGLTMKAIEEMRCNPEEYFPYCRISQPSRSLVQLYERYLCEGVNTSCPLLENGEEDIAQFNLETVLREIIQCAKLEGYRPTRNAKSKVLLSDIIHIPVLYLAITTDGAVLDTHKGMVVQMVKVVTPMLVQRSLAVYSNDGAEAVLGNLREHILHHTQHGGHGGTQPNYSTTRAVGRYMQQKMALFCAKLTCEAQKDIADTISIGKDVIQRQLLNKVQPVESTEEDDDVPVHDDEDGMEELADIEMARLEISEEDRDSINLIDALCSSALLAYTA